MACTLGIQVGLPTSTKLCTFCPSSECAHDETIIPTILGFSLGIVGVVLVPELLCLGSFSRHLARSPLFPSQVLGAAHRQGSIMVALLDHTMNSEAKDWGVHVVDQEDTSSAAPLHGGVY